MSAQPGSGAALSDRLSMGLLVLTAVSGIVDAVSFLGLGHIFTANMTGNSAFLAFADCRRARHIGRALNHLAGRIPERRGASRDVSGAIPPEIDKPLHLPALQPAEMAIR